MVVVFQNKNGCDVWLVIKSVFADFQLVSKVWIVSSIAVVYGAPKINQIKIIDNNFSIPLIISVISD